MVPILKASECFFRFWLLVVGFWPGIGKLDGPAKSQKPKAKSQQPTAKSHLY